MKHVIFATLLATALGLPATVLAQADKTATAQRPATAKLDASQAPKSEGRRGSSRAHLDARECLAFSTNMEIHRCAEKYR